MIADDTGSNNSGAEEGNLSNLTLDDTLREAGANAVEEALRRLMGRQQPIPGPVEPDQGTSKTTNERGQLPPPGSDKRPATTTQGDRPKGGPRTTWEGAVAAR